MSAQIQETILISRQSIAKMLGCSPKTIDRLRERGEMPPPLIVAPRTIRWRKAEIEDWLASRQAK